MTLDEAIKHCLEVAEEQEKEAEYHRECHKNYYEKDCRECAAEHRQLAEWLTELKKAKRLLKAAVPIINNTFPETGSCWGCANHDEAKDECKGGAFAECSEVCKWEHADEALALIGEDTNVGHKSGGWISCEERLPEENILVLCYARSTTGEGNSYFLGAIAHGEFWFLQVNDIGHASFPVLHWEVTHWQPLPKSPKEGDTNG